MSFKTLMKIAFSIAFLVYISFKIDIKSLYSAYLEIEPGYYLLALCFMFLNCLIYAFKLKIILNLSEIIHTFQNLVKINLLCRFYSTFLTAAIGQSFIRWHYTTKNNKGVIEFIAVILYERSTFLFALLIISGPALFFSPYPHITDIALRATPFILICLFSLLLFFIYLNYPPLFHSFSIILKRFKSAMEQGIIEKVFRILDTFSVYKDQRRVLFYSLLLAFIWQFLFLIRVYLLVVSINAPLDFLQVCWMASLVLLIQVLPISLNGIGLRETAYAFLFGLHGIPPEKGVLLGLLLLTQVLLMAAIGGVIHIISKD
ncbi:MAG: flippase-like domain-containing protein [Deltaproteobacteria bacterium]|nr:flippase-like domain-containing protein [Deltaproteobacteria bacterium]